MSLIFKLRSHTSIKNTSHNLVLCVIVIVAVTVRSYYKHTDSELYYLQSCYYDPKIGRFINADDPSLLGANGDFTSYNLFGYCGNNPVVRADTQGDIWHIAIGAGIGAFFGVMTKLATNAINDQPLAGGLWTAGIAGAVSGGLAASGVGLAGQIIGNATISMVNNAADQCIGWQNGSKTDSFDYGSLFLDGAIGAIAGFAGGSGAGSKNLTQIGLTNIKRTYNAFTHHGIKAAGKVLSKGLSYFGKNTSYMIKPLVKAIVKSSISVITNNEIKKLTAMERRLAN